MSKIMEYEKILRKCPLLGHAESKHYRELAETPHCIIREYGKGSFLFEEDEKPRAIYVLLQGKVSIARDTLAGSRLQITQIDVPGDIFGEVYLFLSREQYDVHAESIEKSIILEIGADLLAYSGKQGSLQELLTHNLMGIFARKAFFMNRRIQVLGSTSIREKIVRFLFQRQKEDGTFEEIPSREVMAEYLNVTRPSLSRELSRMQEEGILRLDGREVQIADQELFEQYL